MAIGRAPPCQWRCLLPPPNGMATGHAPLSLLTHTHTHALSLSLSQHHVVLLQRWLGATAWQCAVLFCCCPVAAPFPFVSSRFPFIGGGTSPCLPSHFTSWPGPQGGLNQRPAAAAPSCNGRALSGYLLTSALSLRPRPDKALSLGSVCCSVEEPPKSLSFFSLPSSTHFDKGPAGTATLGLQLLCESKYKEVRMHMCRVPTQYVAAGLAHAPCRWHCQSRAMYTDTWLPASCGQGTASSNSLT